MMREAARCQGTREDGTTGVAKLNADHLTHAVHVPATNSYQASTRSTLSFPLHGSRPLERHKNAGSLIFGRVEEGHVHSLDMNLSPWRPSAQQVTRVRIKASESSPPAPAQRNKP